MGNHIDIVEKIWREYCDPNGWNFVTNGLRNGDLYFALTLMRAFRASNPNTSVHLLVQTRGHHSVSRLFLKYLDSADICPELSLISTDDVLEWCRTTGRNRFEVGSLILLHPYAYANDQFKVLNVVGQFGGLVNYIDLQKILLRLPVSTAPSPPEITSELRDRASALFRSYDLTPASTLVIFPYAQSLKFDAIEGLIELGRQAREIGLTVCTAAHGDEQQISGTKRIELTFDILVPFCELAGYVVALRSGIGDMLANASNRKVYVYPSGGAVYYETTNSFGMFDNNENVRYTAFANAREFGDEVIRLLTQEKLGDGSCLVPPAVKSAFQIARSCTPEIRFSRSDELIFASGSDATFGRYRFFQRAALGEGWASSEPWGVWSNGFRAVLYIERKVDENAGIEGILLFELSAIFSISERNPELNINIDFDGIKSSYTARWPQREHVFKFTVAGASANRRYHRLIFDILNPVSPTSVSQGISDDSRILGIGLVRATFAASVICARGS
jgi:hypothetical protein